MNRTRGNAWRIALAGTAVLFAGCGSTEKKAGPAAAATTAAPTTTAVTAPTTVPSMSAPVLSRTVTARGTGHVDVKPDLLRISMGVETFAVTTAEVLDTVTSKAALVNDAMKALGVPPADIQTTQLTVYPRYDNPGPYASQTISGYVASVGVSVKATDIARASTLVDAAARAAGDAFRVNGLNWSVDKPEPLLAVARADAVAKAGVQAKQLAEAAGLKLGAIRSINDESSFGYPYPYGGQGEMGGGAGIPLEPGSSDLTVQVTVVYEIL
jgi:uncharacterized protein